MTATILDGKQTSAHWIEEIYSEVKARVASGFMQPGLAVILIGNDPASKLYVANKYKAAKAAGLVTHDHFLPETVTETAILQLIDTLNNDPTVHGILVQLPLPKHIDANKILEAISPNKDVDGFHPYNVGRLLQRRPSLRPCTPFGIIHMLEQYKIPLKGIKATIVGASNIVGRPMAMELLIAGATVKICHRFTKNLAAEIKDQELVIAAVGKPNLIKGEWLQPGAIAIDVGINRLDDGSIVGDFEFAIAKERASFITPVPGGVGPMTVAALLYNTLLASK